MKEFLKNSQIKWNSVWGDFFYGAFFAVGNLLGASLVVIFLTLECCKKQLDVFIFLFFIGVNLKSSKHIAREYRNAEYQAKGLSNKLFQLAFIAEILLL